MFVCGKVCVFVVNFSKCYLCEVDEWLIEIGNAFVTIYLNDEIYFTVTNELKKTLFGTVLFISFFVVKYLFL